VLPHFIAWLVTVVAAATRNLVDLAALDATPAKRGAAAGITGRGKHLSQVRQGLFGVCVPRNHWGLSVAVATWNGTGEAAAAKRLLGNWRARCYGKPGTVMAMVLALVPPPTTISVLPSGPP
jgi:hypothetical protein